MVIGRQEEQTFFNYIKNKNIILVGPANFLTGKNRGQEIDSYDLVARMNFSVPVSEELKKDLGSKTDVLYKRLLKRIEKQGDYYPKPKEIKMWKKIGINWVVAIATSKTKKVGSFGSMIEEVLPWTVTGSTKGEVKGGSGVKQVFAGLIAVKHMLKAPIKSLTVTNCTFYDTGYYDGYRGLQGKAATENTDRRDFGVLDQLKYLNHLRKNDSRLIFDNYLESIVKEKL